VLATKSHQEGGEATTRQSEIFDLYTMTEVKKMNKSGDRRYDTQVSLTKRGQPNKGICRHSIIIKCEKKVSDNASALAIEHVGIQPTNHSPSYNPTNRIFSCIQSGDKNLEKMNRYKSRKFVCFVQRAANGNNNRT